MKPRTDLKKGKQYLSIFNKTHEAKRRQDTNKLKSDMKEDN